MSKPGGVNTTVLWVGLALIVPLLLLFALSFGNDPRAVPDAMSGKPAPDFTLVDLTGKTHSLSELRGKPVVLNFWSTWCGPCKQEHPHLQQAALQHPDVAFFGVIYSDEPAKCRVYLDRVGTTYDHLVDPTGRTAIDYGVAGVPETYFIGPDGTIAYKHAGALSGQMIAQVLSRMGAQ